MNNQIIGNRLLLSLGLCFALNATKSLASDLKTQLLEAYTGKHLNQVNDSHTLLCNPRYLVNFVTHCDGVNSIGDTNHFTKRQPPFLSRTNTFPDFNFKLNNGFGHIINDRYNQTF